MRTILLATAVLGLTAATALPASATEQSSEASLVITAYNGEDTSWPVIKEITLKCEPTGGNHVHAEDACASLDAVDGDFDALPDRQLLCPDVYQPVTIEVGGAWYDQVVSFERTYPNLCHAFSESDGIFDFQ
jgi:hypothetical protein